MPYTTYKIKFGNRSIKSSIGKSLNYSAYVLPEGLILLDYFKPGFRFGNIPQGEIITEDFSDENTDNLNYFNHEIFGNTFPTLKRDGAANDDFYCYDIDELVAGNEFSIEFLVKYQGSSGSFGNSVFIEMPVYGGYAQQYFHSARVAGNYRNGPSSYPWVGYSRDCPSIPPASPIGKDNYCSSWKHIVYTKTKNNQMYWFMNGQMWYNTTVIELIDSLKLYLIPCVIDVNNWNTKYYGYNITQLAVWNYAKYTSNFEVSKNLIINE